MSAQGTQGEESLSYELWYSVQEGEHEKNHLTIRPDGSVSGRIMHARAGSPVHALGFFFVQPGPKDADLVEVARLIDEGGLHGGESLNVTRAPGLYSKIFQIQIEGVQTEHYQSSRDPLPEALVPLDTKLREVLERLGDGPLSTLQVQLDLDPSAIQPGDDVQVGITFRNPGRFETVFRNPAAYQKGTSDTFQINFWTEQPAETGTRDEYEWTLDLIGNEFLVAERKAVSSREPYLSVAPGEALRMWTTLRYPQTDPGNYKAELTYYAAPPTQEEATKNGFVVGEYHATPIPIQVAPR